MLEGKVGDFSLPEIFQLIALTKKSGTLRVTTPKQAGHVRFRDGEVAEAAADVRRLALGARLVASGLVDEHQLAAALEAKRDHGGEVLRLLLQHAAIDEGALHAFVREQIADAVADMLRFDEAAFRFDSDDVPAEPLIDVQVPTEQLVTEGNQRLAEWEAIREHVPSSDTVFAVSPAPPGGGEQVNVDADAWQILALVDGRRPVEEIVDLSGRSEFSTSKALAGLVARKLVEPCGDGDDGGPLSSLLARREVLRRLEELELSELPPDPPQPAPATERPEPEPASEGPAPAGDRHGPAGPDVPPATPSTGEHAPPEPPGVPGDAGKPDGEAPGSEQERAGAEAVPPVPSFEPEGPEGDAAGEEPAEPLAVEPFAEMDRAQVARELAALGLDDLPSGPASNGAASNGAGSNGAGTNDAATNDAAASDQRPVSSSGTEQPGGRRLVRDDDINKGLLLRLIDGVKGA